MARGKWTRGFKHNTEAIWISPTEYSQKTTFHARKAGDDRMQCHPRLGLPTKPQNHPPATSSAPPLEKGLSAAQRSVIATGRDIQWVHTKITGTGE